MNAYNLFLIQILCSWDTVWSPVPAFQWHRVQVSSLPFLIYFTPPPFPHQFITVWYSFFFFWSLLCFMIRFSAVWIPSFCHMTWILLFWPNPVLCGMISAVLTQFLCCGAWFLLFWPNFCVMGHDFCCFDPISLLWGMISAVLTQFLCYGVDFCCFDPISVLWGMISAVLIQFLWCVAWCLLSWPNFFAVWQRSQIGQCHAGQGWPHQDRWLRHVQGEDLWRESGLHLLRHTRLHCTRGETVLALTVNRHLAVRAQTMNGRSCRVKKSQIHNK